MDWYETSLRVAHRPKADMISQKITKDIVNKVNSKNPPDVYFVDLSQYPLLQENKLKEIEVTISIINNGFIPYNVSGKTISTEKKGDVKSDQRIEILIIIVKSKYNKTSYHSLFEDLLEVVRHEIQHVVQDIDAKIFNVKKSEDLIFSINQTFRYVSNKLEQDAFVKGMILKAKREKKDAYKIFNDYLIGLLIQTPYYDSEKQTKEDIKKINEVLYSSKIGDEYFKRYGRSILDQYKACLELYKNIFLQNISYQNYLEKETVRKEERQRRDNKSEQSKT